MQIAHLTLADQITLLEAFIEQNLRGIIVTDARVPDNPIVFVNRAFEILTGYTSAEVRGRNCRFLQVHDSEIPQLAILREAIEAGEPVKVLLPNQRKDGSVFCNELAVAPVRDTDGTTIYYLGSIQDVTTRESLQDELHRQHTRMRAVVDSISDAFYSLDREWRFTYVNAPAERQLCRTHQELLGADVWKEFPELEATGLGQAFRSAFSTGKQVVHTEYYAPLDKWFHTRIYPFDDGVSVIFQDVTEQQTREARLHYAAEHDHLTGLLNRESFLATLEAQLQSAAHGSRPFFAVAFIDLDEFKEVNDMLGHASGDEALVIVAQRLRDFWGAEHIPARMSGDEFVILLRCADATTAGALISQLLDELAKGMRIAGIELALGASAGLACYPEGGESAEEFMRHADVAMYEAKAAGKFTYRIYYPGMSTGAVHKLTLLRELSDALKEQQFHLVYQPQISMDDGRVIGAEALIRWDHPTRGLLSPGSFIPVAEEFSHILRIGEWVLDAACAQMSRWLPKIPAGFRLAVNMSARHVTDPSLPTFLASCLAHHGVPGDCLELEMTESSLAADVVSVAATLTAVRDMGVTVAIDDFGTGYSNLRYLHRFPIGTLKVDRSFIANLPDDESSAKMLDAIIAIARSLGVKTLAEGVETLDQLNFVQERGCDSCQGYLISRPISAAGFEAFLDDPSWTGADGGSAH